MQELDGTQFSHRATMETDLGTFTFEGSGEFVSKQSEYVISILEIFARQALLGGQAENALTNQNQAQMAYDYPETDLLLTHEQARDLANFLTKLGIDSHQERYVAILSWLEGNKNMNEISSSELEQIYTQLNIPLPQHPSQIFWDAKSRKGWFQGTDAEGYYRLTDTARKFFNRKLAELD